VRSIYDLSFGELTEFITAVGEKSFRVSQIFSALHNGITTDEISNIPKSLKKILSENFNCNLPVVVECRQSKDGTKKYLLKYAQFAHDDFVECVFLTQEYGNTICVSTQVGCRMGCTFCASGKGGLVRNLTAGEILAEVILINKLNAKNNERGVTNIVLMGSGEPLDNFDNVMKFLELVTSANGINISGRNISLSTSGLVPQIKKFADCGGQVNLCISLHAPNDELRTQIMPIAKKYSVAELIDAAKYFFEKTHRRVIFEYSLMCQNGAPFNCTVECAKELAKLVRGFPAHINLINLNPLPVGQKTPPDRQTPYTPPDSQTPYIPPDCQMPYTPPDSQTPPIPPDQQILTAINKSTKNIYTPPGREVAKKFMDTIIKSGISCTMRKNRGDDIDGACGQLRLRYVDNPAPS
jgi:23S rRNA (adenine2503-C2)-methyltransferase